MTREEVYRIIDGERDYQDARWGNTLSGDRPGDGSRSVDEFVLYVAGYLQDAVRIASHVGDQAAKLAAPRKVVALGVACFEQHGCPPREVGP